MAKRSNFPSRIVARQEAAGTRLSERAERTDEEQIEKLQSEGYGRCREVARLEKQIG